MSNSWIESTLVSSLLRLSAKKNDFPNPLWNTKIKFRVKYLLAYPSLFWHANQNYLLIIFSLKKKNPYVFISKPLIPTVDVSYENENISKYTACIPRPLLYIVSIIVILCVSTND